MMQPQPSQDPQDLQHPQQQPVPPLFDAEMDGELIRILNLGQPLCWITREEIPALVALLTQLYHNPPPLPKPPPYVDVEDFYGEGS